MIPIRSVTFRALEEVQDQAAMDTLHEAAAGVAAATVQVWAIRLAASGFTRHRDMTEALAVLAAARNRLSDGMDAQDPWTTLEDRSLPPRTRLERAQGWVPGTSRNRRAA